jgi:hypothetical protein
MSLLPSDSEKQSALYIQVIRMCDGKELRTIKGALLNALLCAILGTSTSEDEAILQWNELSLRADELIRKRYACKIALHDQFDPTKTRFNGG